MADHQKREFRNHHKDKIILLSVISYTKYKKITNRESTKHMFDSLRMTHEGNTQVNETKALALIKKYEAFKMKEDETIETMFSRFQILVAGLKVLGKGYSTADHVKKTIKSLFLAYNADLWDMVTDGYIHPVDESGQKIDRKIMSDN